MSYLDNTGREFEAGVGCGHVVQQGRVCDDGGGVGVVSQGGDVTKYSTKIDMEFKEKFDRLSLTAYRDSRMVPARISRENFASLASWFVGVLTVKVVISFY